VSGHHFARAAVRRLCQALASGDAATVLAAGTVASALVHREAHPDAAARRAAAMLEAVLLDATDAMPDGVRKRIEHALEDCLADPTVTPASACLDRLWRELADAFSSPGPDAEGSLAAEIQEYLAASVGEHATLGELARRLGYSRAHVSTLVHRLVGKPFRVLRREMQLARVRWLLEHGASVKTAALEAGFSEPAYLSRVFTRHHGVPPSRWRRRAVEAPHRRTGEPSGIPTGESSTAMRQLAVLAPPLARRVK
jgi:AraC-like DNA-binding protein